MERNNCARQRVLPSHHVDRTAHCQQKHLPLNDSMIPGPFSPPLPAIIITPEKRSSTHPSFRTQPDFDFPNTAFGIVLKTIFLPIPNVVDTSGRKNSTEAWSSLSFPSQRHYMSGVKRHTETQLRQFKTLHYRLACLRGVLQSETVPKRMRTSRWGRFMKKENVP
ncbi:hypothetical protein [Desulfoluna spongiiphila]|uniref:hypothetical protein n=1 Tax=Desulfoluna spongiiphila TaxID=419481 RepID=UPI00125F6743|nr:hypothetical protein [Desulfoluna spongiiphila]